MTKLGLTATKIETRWHPSDSVDLNLEGAVSFDSDALDTTYYRRFFAKHVSIDDAWKLITN